jgi:hypothetical protein
MASGIATLSIIWIISPIYEGFMALVQTVSFTTGAARV